MGMADEMKALREDIDASQLEREKYVANNAKDVKDMLKQFRKEHEEMAKVLRSDLEAFVTGNKKETNALLKEAKTLMKGYRIELDAMHDAWIGKASGRSAKGRKAEKETG